MKFHFLQRDIFKMLTVLVPGTRCSVTKCNNSLVKTKSQGLNITYHSFPKDIKRQQIWIRRCRADLKMNPNTSAICSVHFQDSDYERDLQNELLGLPLRRKLKKTAVPSLHHAKEIILESESKDKRIEHGDKEESVRDLSENPIEAVYVEHSPSNKLCDNNLQTYSNPLNDYEKLNAEFSMYKLKTKRKVKSLENLVRYYKKKHEVSSKYKVQDILKPVFSKNQIDLILKKKSIVHWTPDEMAKAFRIRHYSEKCYVYLQKTLNYPLPGLSTLRKHAAAMYSNLCD